MSERRVVITGIGVLTPLSSELELFWQNLLAGKSGIGLVTRFDTTAYDCKIGGEVRDFKPEEFMPLKETRRTDRFVQYAVGAAKKAVVDAGVNMASGYVSMLLGAKGPNLAVVSACATATHALGEAARAIVHNDADIMIAGGTEAAVTQMGYAGFCAMKAMSTRNSEPERASRPFDAERDGFVMGEGAGVCILESLEHARKRHAKIYCEVVGYGITGDAYHMSAPAPEGEGAARSMVMALGHAKLNPEQVDYINAHGTSTPVGDKCETQAIKKVFGAHAQKLAVSSTKSMTGHLLGAAGAVETAVCALAIRDGIVPPTINYENPDPDCDLDYVPNKARPMKVGVCLNNSLGFGGHNATIIVKRHE